MKKLNCINTKLPALRKEMYYSLVGWLDIENDRAIIADRLKSFVLHSVCGYFSIHTYSPYEMRSTANRRQHELKG